VSLACDRVHAKYVAHRRALLFCGVGSTF
jgi:hypothetical protein